MDPVIDTPRPAAPYLRGLDGLRAVSVLAVMAYHAGVGGFDGGYLGVEVFFVISGFLITRLLLTEWETTGGVDLKAFWVRRARRLLPALFGLLIGVVPLMMAFAPDSLEGLGSEIVAAAAYVTNWFLILDDQSYFEAFARPSPLRHLWSLAVEEQFYLIWPIAVVGAFRLGGRRLALRVAVVGTIASLGWAAGLSFSSDTGADPTRLYFGSDTRAAGLLMGAALALSQLTIRRFAVGWSLVAAIGLGAGVHLLDGSDPFLFRGGLFLVALATVVLLAAIAAPASTLDRALGWAPLAAVGQRSYALYLWHWPVVVLTRPRVDTTLDGWRLYGAQLLLSVVLAELSFRLIEDPVRRGHGPWASRRRRRTRHHPLVTLMASGRFAARLSLAALAVTLVVISLGRIQDPALASSEDSSHSAVVDADLDDGPPPPGRTSPLQGNTSAEVPPDRFLWDDPGPALGDLAAPEPAPPAARPPLVAALGDSVMRGAARHLEAVFPGIVLDAETNRYNWELHSATPQEFAAADVIVVHLGQNGPPSAEMIDTLLASLDPVQPVVLVTVRAPVRWESKSNAAITDAAERWPNVQVADWNGFANEQWDWFIRDGVHLRPVGKEAYAQFLLAETLAAVTGAGTDAGPGTDA